MQGHQPQQEEFLRAYDAYSDAIFRHCYYRCYDRERAKDLMQECFMKTWEYIAAGKKVDNVRAFLYRVANNLVIDESRRKKTDSLDEMMEETGEQVFDVPAGEAAAKAPENAAEIRLVKEALEKLDGKYKDVVSMRYLEGLSPKEIAQIVGESENVVSVRIHRGIAQLRQLL